MSEVNESVDQADQSAGAAAQAGFDSESAAPLPRTNGRLARGMNQSP